MTEVANIKKVAVIGSGVMGSGIAAQVANAGVPVLLLDIVGKDANDRSSIARGAIEKALKTQPAPFMSPRNAKLVTPGNLEDDLEKLAECDWIVEVIIERLDLKQELYKKIEKVRKPGTVMTSNTSTIPLSKLVEGAPDGFAKDFFITHFFNPPRYMRLLEVVTGPATDAAAVERVSQFCDVALGKSVVVCKDSPGFIANRLGIYWMQCGILEAIDGGLSIEEADAVMGRPFGMPSTGIFGLLDLVGIDLGPHINASLAGLLPQSDPFHGVNRDIPLITKMIETGYTGRKGKGGFYRIDKSKGGKDKQAIDLKTGDYSASRKADVPELEGADKRLRKLMETDTKAGRYAKAVMSRVLGYAAMLLPEACDEIVAIDEAMRLGYAWKQGPFELIDKIGAPWLVQTLEADGYPVSDLLRKVGDHTFYRIENGKRQFFGLDGAYHDFKRPDGVVMLEDIKLTAQPILKNASAALWDIGDGVVCLEFTSKSNSLDEQIMELIQKSIRLVKEKYKALVFYNEGSNFCVGANIGLALFAANIAAFGEIERLISGGQQAMKALKYAPFPVVSAPAGMALGGGCEILLHSDAVQAHAETYAGLVEVGVGLIPGWGGCKEMLVRWQHNKAMPRGPMPAPAKVFEMVSTASVSKSAAEAKDMLILRKDDAVTMNRYRLLADAKAKALALAENYAPPEEKTLSLPGASGRVGMAGAVDGFRKRGMATPYDVTVAKSLAYILTGGDRDPIDVVTEDEVMALERHEFMRLVQTPGTLARIEHMLETGKPLRN